MNIEYCHKTDVGLKRTRNEDFSLTPEDYEGAFESRHMGMVFAVADGMGGHPAGNLASRIACKTFLKHYFQTGHVTGALIRGISLASCKPIKKRVVKAIKEADRQVCHYGCKHEMCKGLGTTLSVLVIIGSWAVIGHVGDSRIYRLRDGTVELLTHDHTFVQDLIDMGEITPKEAKENPMRHVLMEALGLGTDEIFTRCERILPGDLFLLCTDGLHDMVSDQEITDVIKNDMMIDKMCEGLVQKALENGGKDNVTTVVVKYIGN